MNKQRAIQVIRFLVQAFFMAGLIFSFEPRYSLIGKKIFLTMLLVGVFFCGWLCPFGALQDWIALLARFLKLPKLRIPQKAQKYLQLSRYVFYALSTISISFVALNARGSFNHRLFEGGLSTAGAWCLGFFIFVALFIDRPFCNYFCTKGAFYGLFSVLRIFGIKKNENKCVHCHRCSQKCPMNIDVEKIRFVRHPNCINCLKCFSACPKKCITFGSIPNEADKSSEKIKITAASPK